MSSQLTPSPEEDLSYACPSSEDGELDSHGVTPPRSRTSNEKGKAKQLEEDTYDDEDPIETSYPPTNDEAAETRRVEENLRRWDMAERERRRAVRESVHIGTGGGPSLLGAVTRRASVLLSNRHASKASSGGLGNHHHHHRALNSIDSSDAVPLTDIDQSPRVSENPFIHPSERDPSSQSSPFDDSKEQSSVMTEISGPPSPCSPDAFDSKMPSAQPTVLQRTSTLVPPPQPLGLPRPLTPPPKEPGPRVTPMKATPTPTLHPEAIEPEQQVRWWHDWLCGCSEGPDRGGDFQAGRTNPFE